MPSGRIKYAGNKLPNRPVGMLLPNDTTCKSLDVLNINKADHTMRYTAYELRQEAGNKNKCMAVDSYLYKEVKLFRISEPGLASAEVVIVTNVPATPEQIEQDPDTLFYLHEEVQYSGPLEIGMLAGYFRIEDKISDYTEGSLNKGKAYLYFHL